MDYNQILKEIKPTAEEKIRSSALSDKIRAYINKLCKEEKIDAEARLVGSQAKGTYLRGKSDIDIFIAFPLSTPEDVLKEKGLEIGYKTNDYFNGESSEHFASHPYITCMIEGFEVDLVPCYRISDGSELKSAVDRTILHTNYILANATDAQKDEMLLLKRFMDCVGVYGSEFKVGGFAGYLCELLILEYGNFENCIKNVANWQFNQVIDLENYKTEELFKKDPLVCIDPTDPNRNVAAALRLNKMCEFIDASRNYLASDNKSEYFNKISLDLDKNTLLNELNQRGSEFIAIKLDIPDIPLDTLHPQLKKTSESLAVKLTNAEFNVFKSGYWTDEENEAVFLFEMASTTLNDIKTNRGPKIYVKNACSNFTRKHGVENCYVLDDFIAVDVKREFKTAVSFIEHVFTPEHISLIKVGKNLKNIILETYEFVNIEDLDLEFLYEFTHHSYKTKR